MKNEKNTRQNENITVSVKKETKIKFDELYEDSQANSKGEFLSILMENLINPENVVERERIVEVEKIVEVPVEVEKRVEVPVTVDRFVNIEVPVPISLKEHELILQLTPLHFEILKNLAENEKLVELHNFHFNRCENFTNLLFCEISETDAVKTKIGKILINILMFIEIYGPHDFLPASLRKSDLVNLINKHYPELISAD